MLAAFFAGIPVQKRVFKGIVNILSAAEEV